MNKQRTAAEVALKLPEPVDRPGLEMERLRAERDMAVADAASARAELHRALCGLRLLVMQLEGEARIAAAPQKIALVDPTGGNSHEFCVMSVPAPKEQT